MADKKVNRAWRVLHPYLIHLHTIILMLYGLYIGWDMRVNGYGKYRAMWLEFVALIFEDTIIFLIVVMLFIISLIVFYLLVWRFLFNDYIRVTVDTWGNDIPREVEGMEGRVYWACGYGFWYRLFNCEAQPDDECILYVNWMFWFNPFFPGRSLIIVRGILFKDLVSDGPFKLLVFERGRRRWDRKRHYTILDKGMIQHDTDVELAHSTKRRAINRQVVDTRAVIKADCGIAKEQLRDSTFNVPQELINEFPGGDD